MANPQIQSLVETFVTQIEGVLRQQVLSSLQAAIGGALSGAGPAKKKAGRPAGSKAKKPSKPGSVVKTSSKAIRAASARVRRTPAQLAAETGRLVSFVKSNPGTTSEKARAALKMDKPTWLKAYRLGIESKQLSTKGAKRTTTLHPKA